MVNMCWDQALRGRGDPDTERQSRALYRFPIQVPEFAANVNPPPPVAVVGDEEVMTNVAMSSSSMRTPPQALEAIS